MDKIRRRLRVEIALSFTSGVLGILTVALPNWIELLTGIDYDHGSSALEWAATGVLLVGAFIAAALARADDRRLATQRA